MGIKIIIKEDGAILVQHGAVVAKVEQPGVQVSAPDVIDKLVQEAYEKGRADYEYELEVAISRLKGSD